jgi:hypothetical protein
LSSKDFGIIDMDLINFDSPVGTVHAVRVMQGNEMIILGGGDTPEEALSIAMGNVTEMVAALSEFDPIMPTFH